MPQEFLITKKRKIVADGIFKAELDSFLRRELAEAGYSGLEVRPTPSRTEVLIRATRSQDVIGERGRRIRELTKLVERRFNFKPHKIELFVEKLTNRGLCAIAQAELLRYKLIGQVPIRRACNGIVHFIMDSGAQGCEVVVSGKLSGQRAKSLKVVAGQMIHAGDACNNYVTKAFSYVELRQGVLGLKVRIMLPHDVSGKLGPMKPLPDKITVCEPKPEKYYDTCFSEARIFSVEVVSSYLAPASETESESGALENVY